MTALLAIAIIAAAAAAAAAIATIVSYSDEMCGDMPIHTSISIIIIMDISWCHR
jgi:hypothetical protein